MVMRTALISLLLVICCACLASAGSVRTGFCGTLPLEITGSGVNATIEGYGTITTCETDVQGPNDEPGQKDLNMYCVHPGLNGSNYFYWTWDEISWSGANTGDACLLLDANNNGLADYALCVSVAGDGLMQEQRFFRCTADARPDRCTGPEEMIAPPSGFKSSCCVVSEAEVDPFYEAGNKKNTGDNYPLDTLARCEVFLEDFGDVSVLKFVDVCSYPSLQPNSDPSDCILTRDCNSDADCPSNGADSCYQSFCDTNIGVCRELPKPAGALCENPNTISFCDGKAVCDGQGVCLPGTPVDCSGLGCDTGCKAPQCVEPSIFTVDTDATCQCLPRPIDQPIDCTGECGGDAECQQGTCNADGTCGCSNLLGFCQNPRDGPCDAQCQQAKCTVGKCLCNNVPDTTLCESNPPDFCDGKDICRNGGCVKLAAPACDAPCSTVCQKEYCVNPTVFDASTAATCVCDAAPERDGRTCEPDSIVCTDDLCNANGECTHPPGECIGCGIDCLQGTCTPFPAQTELNYIWDDGCLYRLFGANGTSLPFEPPVGGTSAPICGNVNNFAAAVSSAMGSQVAGATTATSATSAGSIALFVVGGVLCVVAVVFFIITIKKRVSGSANAQEMI